MPAYVTAKENDFPPQKGLTNGERKDLLQTIEIEGTKGQQSLFATQWSPEQRWQRKHVADDQDASLDTVKSLANARATLHALSPDIVSRPNFSLLEVRQVKFNKNPSRFDYQLGQNDINS
jgi:epoxyqueuosine reductase QueG